MKYKEMLFNQLDGLYAVQEIDMEFFSQVDEDGNLEIQEEQMVAFRVHRMLTMFHTIYMGYDEKSLMRMKFLEAMLDWIIIKKNTLGHSDSDCIERKGLVAIAVVLKQYFDRFVEQND
jgi:hypothetical protein